MSLKMGQLFLNCSLKFLFSDTYDDTERVQPKFNCCLR